MNNRMSVVQSDSEEAVGDAGSVPPQGNSAQLNFSATAFPPVLNTELSAMKPEIPLRSEEMGALSKVISFQSLLATFANVGVRADFVNGKFEGSYNSKFLDQVDELRWMLMPSWSGGYISGTNERALMSARHMSKLINRAEDVLSLDSAHREDGCYVHYSYSIWYDMLQGLASDRYWYENNPSTRCSHIKKEPSRQRTAVRPKNELYVSSLNEKVEELIISSSDESSTDSTGGSVSSNSSCGNYGRRTRSSKEVVTPPVFKLNGRQTLKEFLSTFEIYFTRKYDGNQLEQTQELSKFLDGDLLRVFNAVGGACVKYRDMKKELISYYKSQKLGGTSFWKRELLNSELEHSEPLRIFGLRLSNIAKKAYPRNKKESAKQLRTKFLEAIPSSISTKILNSERMMKPFSSHKHMNFTALVEMANDLQSHDASVSEKKVMWSSNLNQERPVRNTSAAPRGNTDRQPSREFSRGKQRQSGVAQRNILCSYCHKPNHTRDKCWRAANLCLICGDEHRMSDCSKYDPDFRRNQSGGKKEENTDSDLN